MVITFHEELRELPTEGQKHIKKSRLDYLSIKQKSK